MILKKYKCGKCHNEFYELQIRKCPHEAVNRQYGNYICVYCCKKCKFVQADGTGWICTYGKGEKDAK